MSRPATLFEAAERIANGANDGKTLAEFLDTFYTEPDAAARCEMLRNEPPPTGSARQDALMAAVAEYLATQYKLPAIPQWVTNPARCLPDPWFTTESDGPGMREYLSISSPAEFIHHNIFTEPRPLRRASQHQPANALRK